MSKWKEISIHEIKNIHIGHAQDEEHGTGCSVIICDEKAPCGVDVRGGGPASRETELLNPRMSNDGINGLFLSGGSAYGLDVAGGVMKYLEEKGKGIQVGSEIVPIVVGSCIFDLNCANGKVRPEVCRRIREISDVAIFFITARVMEEDELNGYALGADDYVTKPFSLPILYAKAMAMMGRIRGENPARRMKKGDIEVDVRIHEVWVLGHQREIAPLDYEMLLFFMENPNRIFSREQLLIRFWGYDFDGNERVVDNHIKKLRKILDGSRCMIQTVRKTGYRMEVRP